MELALYPNRLVPEKMFVYGHGTYKAKRKKCKSLKMKRSVSVKIGHDEVFTWMLMSLPTDGGFRERETEDRG